MSTAGKQQHVNELAEVISALKSHREVASFLRDLLSPRELEMIPQRWAIIVCLSQRLTYAEIQMKARVSSKRVATATIGRAKRAFDESNGGFALALTRMRRSRKNVQKP